MPNANPKPSADKRSSSRPERSPSIGSRSDSVSSSDFSTKEGYRHRPMSRKFHAVKGALMRATKKNEFLQEKNKYLRVKNKLLKKSRSSSQQLERGETTLVSPYQDDFLLPPYSEAPPPPTTSSRHHGPGYTGQSPVLTPHSPHQPGQPASWYSPQGQPPPNQQTPFTPLYTNPTAGGYQNVPFNQHVGSSVVGHSQRAPLMQHGIPASASEGYATYPSPYYYFQPSGHGPSVAGQNQWSSLPQPAVPPPSAYSSLSSFYYNQPLSPGPSVAGRTRQNPVTPHASPGRNNHSGPFITQQTVQQPVINQPPTTWSGTQHPHQAPPVPNFGSPFPYTHPYSPPPAGYSSPYSLYAGQNHVGQSSSYNPVVPLPHSPPHPGYNTMARPESSSSSSSLGLPIQGFPRSPPGAIPHNVQRLPMSPRSPGLGGPSSAGAGPGYGNPGPYSSST